MNHKEFLKTAKVDYYKLPRFSDVAKAYISGLIVGFLLGGIIGGLITVLAINYIN